MSVTSAEYWLSTKDMPLLNWEKCTDGDIRYCKILPDITKKVTKKDAEQWALIYDSYIKKYGLSDLFKKVLKVKEKKAKLELKYVITKERFKLTEIEIQEVKLEKMLKNLGQGCTISQSLIYLSRWLGYQINKKEITADEYFELSKEYAKNNKTK